MKRPKGWTKNTFYRLGDSYYVDSLLKHSHYNHFPTKGKHVKAIWGGEHRAPKKGEWYLSGCENFVCAYRAPNDLSTEYFIAKIVEVETNPSTKLIKHLDN